MGLQSLSTFSLIEGRPPNLSTNCFSMKLNRMDIDLVDNGVMVYRTV